MHGTTSSRARGIGAGPASKQRLVLPHPAIQPPIGILLCTQKNHELAEYALADMSNTLFVSRYQVQLPGKEEIAEFLQKAAKELRDE